VAVATTEIGDALRDEVIALLEADGHRISREVRVDTKRVDILVELDDDLVPRIAAVECKNLSRTTSQDDLSRIYSDYLSLVETRRITEIWVIVRQDLSPEAKSWAEARANFYAFTLAEFHERTQGFRRYVRQASSIFDDDHLSEFYIQQNLASGEPLSQYVLSWAQSNETRPLALLGGYGMGKTSFCKYLVSKLSEAYLKDPLSRIPVYIRLSDIAKEQELEGLVAKTLAHRYRISNYYFEKFAKLNEKGRFVVIFDGFDEMKHALTWPEFRYNFSQINRTVGGRAKVIVAGRPNAFLSDDEHSWALRGIRTAGERVLRLPDSPEYIELEIQAFSEDDAREFLRRYLRAQKKRILTVDEIPTEASELIERRVADFSRIKRRDAILRPVHLRIFSDLAADETVELRDFSVFELYDISTRQVAEREAGKPERALIDPVKRQAAIEEVAWWLWESSEGRRLNFIPGDVPRSIIRAAFEPQADHSEDAMCREIFSGSFVERKYGENYYFSHRSF
jgi:hypothetical protein